MKGMLDPVFGEKVIGHAEVRQILQKHSGVGNDRRNLCSGWCIPERLYGKNLREENRFFEGPLASLKRCKEMLKEVKSGYECGLVIRRIQRHHRNWIRMKLNHGRSTEIGFIPD